MTPALALPRATLVVRHALVATCDAGAHDAGLVADGAVAVADRLVAWVGPDRHLAGAVDAAGAEEIDAGGRLVTPGLVDSHTHLVFAGERAREHAARCAGASYLDVARAGGGIASTVRATAAATDGELLAGALARAERLLAQGVTTVEVKSGYGLEVEAELRLLGVVEALRHALWSRLTVVPTLLALHALPAGADRARHVARVRDELVPAAAERRLAVACDAFLEEGAFTAAECREVLSAAARAGLATHLHADQLTPGGGARLAAELGCASADHLERVDEAGVAALAAAGVVAGLLPTSTLFLRLAAFAPARRLLDAGAAVSLATNVNPGSAMSETPALTLGLACAALGLTPAEALVAFTAGGARALRRADVGRLAPGCEADLVLWGCRDLEHLPWHLGVPHALRVVKRGRTVHQAAPGAAADCA
ncbi:MAG TPA: imidazolonepropionase [Anaeromyxobacteraceae bacterium]|nr:imidazolonepropionase [Anaeromyxobacteraceae bacterium]